MVKPQNQAGAAVLSAASTEGASADIAALAAGEAAEPEGASAGLSPEAVVDPVPKGCRPPELPEAEAGSSAAGGSLSPVDEAPPAEAPLAEDSSLGGS